MQEADTNRNTPCLLIPGHFLFLICLFLFLQLSSQVSSQTNQFYTKTYTTDQGLANNHVTNIIQDRNGVLWIANYDGLSRFDGYEFKNYYSDPKDTTSLGVAQLDAMAVDCTNNIWILARGTLLYKFDRKSESFVKYNSLLGISTSKLDQASLLIDRYGNLWLLTTEGFLKYNPGTNQKEMIPFQDPSLIPKMNWGFMSFDDRGDLWILNHGQAYHFNQKRGSANMQSLNLVEKWRLESDQGEIVLQTNFSCYFSVIHTRKNNVWMTSNGGISFLDTISGRFSKYRKKIPEDEFYDNQVLKWSDFSNGLHIYYPKTRQEICIKSESNYLIETSFIDNQGTIWAGSLSSISEEGLGLKKIVPTGRVFHNVILQNKSNGNKNCAVFSVSKDRSGNIWVGTRDYNYLTVVTPEGKVKKGFTIPMKDHLTGTSPRSILFDSLNNVWVGYLGDLLIRYNLTTHDICYYNRSEFFLKAVPFMTSFRKLLYCANGEILVGGGYGFCLFNPSQNKISFSYDHHTNSIVSVCMNEKNTEYWIGTHGPIKYFKDQKYVKDIEINESRSDVSSFLVYNDTTLWIALFGGGICRLNPRTFRYEQFTTADGLSNNSTYNIFKDSRNNLWISTNKGISRFNPATKQFWNFGVEDGLFIEEFNGNAAYQGKDGEIIYGGMGGIVHFYPDSVYISADNAHHDLLISGFKVSGFIQTFDSAVSEKSVFLLQKGQDNFSLNFACIDLKNAEKIRYRYCLRGYNEDWVITDSKHRYLSYANLAPGTYRCVVEASDVKGEWRNRKAVTIIIPPTFFQMTLVRILAIAVSVAIISLLLVMIFRNLKRKVEKREEALRNEVNYRGQMNPHFISNIMTSISDFMNKKDEAGANQFLSTVRDLIRKFLYNSEEDYIPLQDELDILELYVNLENQGREQKIVFSMDIDERIDPYALKIVPSLIQPLLENSIVHGFRSIPGKSPVLIVKLRFDDENRITCFVEDNGEGRSASGKVESTKPRKHRSVAIENIRNRLKIHSYLTKRSYELKYLSDIAEGTVAMINIPAKY